MVIILTMDNKYWCQGLDILFFLLFYFIKDDENVDGDD